MFVDFWVVLESQFCGGGRPLCVSTSTFQPREDMPKYHREKMLGVVFLLETESRSAAGLSCVTCPHGGYSQPIFGGPGGRCVFGGEPAPLPIAHPYAPAGLAPIPQRQERPLSDPRPHTHAHTHTLPLRAPACARPGGTALDPARDPALARSSRSEHVKESH